MIRRQFLPHRPTNQAHSRIYEPANEHASAKPCLPHHALGRNQAAHSQHQYLITRPDTDHPVGARFIPQSIETHSEKALSPFVDSLLRHTHFTRHSGVGLPFGTDQNNARPLRSCLRGLRAPCPLLQVSRSVAVNASRDVGRPVRMVCFLRYLRAPSVYKLLQEFQRRYTRNGSLIHGGVNKLLPGSTRTNHIGLPKSGRDLGRQKAT